MNEAPSPRQEEQGKQRAGPSGPGGVSAWMCLGILLAVVLAVFWPVLTFDFVDWDDFDMAAGNADFMPPAWGKIGHYWTGPHLQLYIPLTYWAYAGLAWVSWAIDGRLLPGVFHAGNLLLHALAAGCVWMILRELLADARAALPGAVLFAVHPLMVEPVAWVGSLNTTLAGCLGMLSLLCYVRHAIARREGRKWGLTYAVATGLLAAALLAKPTALVAPLFALLIDWLLLRRPIRQVAQGVVPWLVIVIPLAVVLRGVQGAEEMPPVPVWFRPFVAADALAWYLVHLAAPVQLTMDHGRTPEWLRGSGQWAWTWVVPAAAMAWAAFRWRKTRVPAAAVGLMVAGVLPVLGLTTFVFQAFSTVAERYFYWSMLGAALLLTHWLAGRMGNRKLVALAMVLLSLLAVRSFAQVWAWRDTFALTGHALKVNPQSASAMAVRAFAYARADDLPRAVEYYRMSLDRRPGDAAVWYNMGNALMRMGRVEEAAGAYRNATRVKPGHLQAHYNLGVALMQMGREKEAGEAFKRAVELDPGNETAERALAAWRGRQDERE